MDPSNNNSAILQTFMTVFSEQISRIKLLLSAKEKDNEKLFQETKDIAKQLVTCAKMNRKMEDQHQDSQECEQNKASKNNQTKSLEAENVVNKPAPLSDSEVADALQGFFDISAPANELQFLIDYSKTLRVQRKVYLENKYVLEKEYNMLLDEHKKIQELEEALYPDLLERQKALLGLVAPRTNGLTPEEKQEKVWNRFYEVPDFREALAGERHSLYPHNMNNISFYPCAGNFDMGFWNLAKEFLKKHQAHVKTLRVVQHCFTSKSFIVNLKNVVMPCAKSLTSLWIEGHTKYWGEENTKFLVDTIDFLNTLKMQHVECLEIIMHYYFYEENASKDQLASDFFLLEENLMKETTLTWGDKFWKKHGKLNEISMHVYLVFVSEEQCDFGKRRNYSWYREGNKLRVEDLEA